MGCPFAMAVYALSLVPLINTLGADDRTAVASLVEEVERRRRVLVDCTEQLRGAEEDDEEEWDEVDEEIDEEICLDSTDAYVSSPVSSCSRSPSRSQTPDTNAEGGHSPSSLSPARPSHSPTVLSSPSYPSSASSTRLDGIAIDAAIMVASLPSEEWERASPPTDFFYADDGQACGKLISLRWWWHKLREEGWKYGYWPNAGKSKLVVKAGVRELAEELFADTGVKIVDGSKNLGAAVGSAEFVQRYWRSKVELWSGRVVRLAQFAKTQPHAALWGFKTGLRNEWKYGMRMERSLAHLLEPLEEAIRSVFLPAFFGSDVAISDDFRDLLALPARCAGMDFDNPVKLAPLAFADAADLARMQKELLLASSTEEIDGKAYQQVREVCRARRRTSQNKSLAELKLRASHRLKKCIAIATGKGASAVFNTSPQEQYGFAIKAKRDYNDLCRMRYHLPLLSLPEKCVCGERYSLDHSQICRCGGLVNERHDDVKKLFALECRRVFSDVGLEPMLAPLEGEEATFRYKTANRKDDARSDVRVRNFFTKKRNAFFEFRVLYPLASSYLGKNASQLFEEVAQQRRREYCQRIVEVDDGDFTPMIMFSNGCMGPEMTAVIKQLGRLIADKYGRSYAHVVTILRAKFAFALARSAIMCLRGSRFVAWGDKHAREMDPLSNVDLAVADLALGVF